METRARFVLIGLFTLAVIVTGFGFVYWLHNTGGLRERTAYTVRFESPVPGLRAGANVLFNGVRVGEVTMLQLSAADPREVFATLLVERSTPVRADTQVSVETQGLMGSPSVMLRGGDAAAAPLSSDRGQAPLLRADPAASQDTMQAAREVLRQINKILADNADPLQGTIANLNTFTGALARNSGKVDSLLEGLERMTGGGAPKAPAPTFDLLSPTQFPTLKGSTGQLIIADPTAIAALETQKILVRADASTVPAAGDGQWSDSIPKLVQSRIIQSFENAKVMRVGRATDGLQADHQLLIDIRAFYVAAAPAPTAQVEFSAKLLGPEGKILDARIFRSEAPAQSAETVAGASGLNDAFGKAATDLVVWVTGAI